MSLPLEIFDIYKNATCLYTKEQVDRALDRMAQEIHYRLEDTNPIFLTVMIGGLITMGHLLTRVDFPLEVDYVHATRYAGELSGKGLKWKNLPTTSLKDRVVLIVDDILDEGITLNNVVKYCYEQGAKQVLTAVLVEKHGTRQPEGLPKADFTGLHVENLYIFGYGMDYKNYLRNAPGIFAVKE